MAVRLIFVYLASFLLSINLVLCQMQNHGGQPQQFQHKFAYGTSYAYKWEVPFTYTYTIPPFKVDVNQYKSTINQAQPDRLDVRNQNYQPPSTQQQEQPSSILQSRFGGDNNGDRVIWEVQKSQQQQPSLQSRFGDDTDQQVTTAKPRQQAEQVKVPIFDDFGRQIGWMYSWVDKQNIPQNSFTTAPSSGLGLSSAGSTESTQPVQTTQILTTDSNSGSSYRPQSSTVQNTQLGQYPMLPPPPSQGSIKQIQQTEPSQQPTMYENSQFGLQTAGVASGAAAPVPSKMCTAEQISSNLCPGAASTGAHPSVSGVNFLTGQQSQDIDRFLQNLQQGMLQTLSSVHQNAQFRPVYTSGDSSGPAVVVGASVSGGPGGGIHSYTFAKA